MKSIKFLFVFAILAISVIIANAQVPSNLRELEFFKTKYFSNQAVRAKRIYDIPIIGQALMNSGGNFPLKANGKELDWGTGRYLRFALEVDNTNNPEALTDDINKSDKKYNVMLCLYESDGKLVEIISKYGNIWGMGYDIFSYDTEGLFSTSFSLEPGYCGIIYYPYIIKATKLSDIVKYDTENASCRPDLDFLKIKFGKDYVWSYPDMVCKPSNPNIGQIYTIWQLSALLDDGDYAMFRLEVDTANSPFALTDDMFGSGKKYNLFYREYFADGTNKGGNEQKNQFKINIVGDKGFCTRDRCFFPFKPIMNMPYWGNQTKAHEIKLKVSMKDITKFSELKKLGDIIKGKPVATGYKATKPIESTKETVQTDFSKAPYSPMGPIVFNPDVNYGSMTDQDGNTYKTVTIGSQTWMAENLRTTHYRNGDPIDYHFDISVWEKQSTGLYRYYHYVTNKEKINLFGAEYNWYAVSDKRNIAPKGWHVPSKKEWQTLIDALGGKDLADSKMKETGNSHWHNNYIEATNETGFTALPNINDNHAYFWSSTEANENEGWLNFLSALKNWGNHYFNTRPKNTPIPVRLVKD